MSEKHFLFQVERKMKRKGHSVRTTIAILSAIFIWIAALIQIVQNFEIFGSKKRPDFGNQSTASLLKSLDYEALKTFWAWKRQNMPLEILFSIFACAVQIRIIL